ncbi:MAG: hypothetical protein BroJett018_52240 [Chloroflexota bacterium]|nr:MAG: hypothetical protein BroJett018_52240 [Chloroflexota bacterium]
MSNTPNPDMQALNRLVGTWQLSGEAVGQVRYEWMSGGFFLIQHVEIHHGGHAINGMEVIGHERLFGAEESSPDIKSRFYDSEGNTLDYVYEIEGDTLTIWGGAKGSPAFYRGTFSADGNRVSGGWQWPGGGYSTTMTRLS